MEQDEVQQPVEFDAQKANSASLAISSLSKTLQIEGGPDDLIETVDEFVERFNQHRVDQSNSDADTVELHLTEEGYRTVASLIRMEGLRRSGEATKRGGAMSARMADDNRELARLFDEAAEKVRRQKPA